jgi:hypothetical protein
MFLMVFTLGNMPRLFFHETLASHRDTVTNCNHAQKAMGCIHQVTYNCHYDNLVVNTVYESDPLYVPIVINILTGDKIAFFISSPCSKHQRNTENKGPPSTIA